MAKITTIMETIKPVLANLISESPSKNNLYKWNLLKEYLQIVVVGNNHFARKYNNLSARRTGNTTDLTVRTALHEDKAVPLVQITFIVHPNYSVSLFFLFR